MLLFEVQSIAIISGVAIGGGGGIDLGINFGKILKCGRENVGKGRIFKTNVLDYFSEKYRVTK